MDHIRPEREELLKNVFNIIRKSGPVRAEDIEKKIRSNKKAKPASSIDIQISLCMLEQRGMVQQFACAAKNSKDLTPKRRSVSRDFYFKAANSKQPSCKDNRTYWQKFCDFLRE
jgi:hypothetical protein